LDFYDEYKRKTDDISIYYSHAWAEHQFKSKFYFDGGGNITENKITNNNIGTYEIFDYKNNDYKKFTITTNNSGKYYPKNGKITFPQGSQGIKVFQQKYKIIWRTKNTPKFQFCDKEILLVSNQSLTITSNNKREILFLLALLNSPINRLILKKNLLQENEQAFFTPIKAIKEFMRVPKITEYNQKTKDEIIKRTEEILALEKETLSDFVDFSKIMIQRFDTISVKDNNLILGKDDKKFELPIKKDTKLIEEIIKENYYSDNLDIKKQKINLSELKSLPIIDLEKQKQLKDYIDDLVFTLYFNIPLENLGLNKSEEIKVQCSKNPHYKLVNE
jgi:hypothetical protein